jgi:hypothetical protein
MDIYYANTYKHEHEKNTKKLRCKIMPKTSTEQIEGNEGSYFYLYPYEDLSQRSFQRGFYVCIEYKNFLRTFLIKSHYELNET